MFFAYPSRPDEFVLKQANLSFPAGETTFIIGKSGSGKSTIGNLLLRFYDAQSGEMTIDRENIQSLDTNWLRNNITLVQQSSVLFNDTIFQNIALGKKNHGVARIEEVKRCLAMAELTETVDRLPRKFFTVVGSGGNSLSGGQKQRIAIARARLRDTPILVLDEATSALDHSNKTLVMEAIRKWRKNKTTIIITHDISQIARDDYVYVLQDGVCTQEGYRYALDLVMNGPFVDFARPTITFPDPIAATPTPGPSISPTRVRRSSTVPSSRLSSAKTVVNSSSFASPQFPETLPPRWPERSFDSLNIQISSRSQRRVSQLSSMALPRQMNNLRNSFRSSAYISHLSLNQTNLPILGQNSEPACSPLFPVNEIVDEQHDRLSALPRRTSTLRLPGRPSGASSSHFSPLVAHMQRMSNARLSMMPLRSPLLPPSPPSVTTPIELDIMNYPLLPDRPSRIASKRSRHRRQKSSISHVSAELRETVMSAFPSRKQRSVTHASETPELNSIKEILGTIWPRLTPKQRLVLLCGFGAAFVTAAAIPMFSWVFSNLLQTLYERNASEEALKWSLVLLGVAAADAIFSYLMHYLLETCGQAWVDSLRIAVVERIIDQPQSWFEGDKNNTSSLTDCLDRNAEEMRNLLGRFASFVFVGATMMIIAITWSFIASWKLTLVGLSTAPAVWAVTRGFETVNGKWEAKSNEAGEAAASIFAETFSNIGTVRALTLEAYFHKKHIDATEKVYKVGLARAAYSGFFFGISDSIVFFITGGNNPANSTFLY